MKSLILVLSGLFLSVGLWAQTMEAQPAAGPGPWSVSGQVYFTKSNSQVLNFFGSSVLSNTTEDFSRLVLNPELNYGINNNTTFSIGVGWITGKQIGSGYFAGQPFSAVRDFVSKTNGFSIDLGAETYLFQNNIFGFLVAIGPYYSFQKSTTDLTELVLNTPNEILPAETIITKNTSYGIAAGPGIDLFLSPRWTINLSFGGISYDRFIQQEGDAEAESIYSFIFNINPGSLGLGIEYQL